MNVFNLPLRTAMLLAALTSPAVVLAQAAPAAPAQDTPAAEQATATPSQAERMALMQTMRARIDRKSVV